MLSPSVWLSCFHIAIPCLFDNYGGSYLIYIQLSGSLLIVTLLLLLLSISHNIDKPSNFSSFFLLYFSHTFLFLCRLFRLNQSCLVARTMVLAGNSKIPPHPTLPGACSGWDTSTVSSMGNSIVLQFGGFC